MGGFGLDPTSEYHPTCQKTLSLGAPSHRGSGFRVTGSASMCLCVKPSTCKGLEEGLCLAPGFSGPKGLHWVSGFEGFAFRR